MSDTRSSEDRVEKRRITVKNDTIELNFLKVLRQLNLLGPKTHRSNGRLWSTKAYVRVAMLEATIKLDLSGEEWDDDYNIKNGRDT